MADTHTFSIGDMQCTVLSDGKSALSLERLTNIFPADAEAIQAAYDALGLQIENVQNNINLLLIRSGGEVILVDTGFGIGKVDGMGHAFTGLDEIGVSRDSIDKVIISHAHGDHIAGLVDPDGNLNFPNATVLFNRVEWAYWYTQKNANENSLSLLSKITHRQATFEAGDEIAPGVTAQAAYGHTPGHTALLLESNGERLLHLVDTLHRLIQFAHPEWSIAFDTDKTVSEPTRREWLAKAADDELLTLFYHLPFPGLGHITREGDAFKWNPLMV